MLTAPQAEAILLAMGFSPFDAYDILADAGADPHPDAEPVRISLGWLFLTLHEWLNACEAWWDNLSER